MTSFIEILEEHTFNGVEELGDSLGVIVDRKIVQIA